jgi:hypothetical protein
MRALIFAMAMLCLPASARENDAWEATAPEVRQWYRSLMQPDNPMISCCGEADAYWADSFEASADGEYIAIVTDTRDVPNRPTIKPGTKIVVPKSKLKYDEGNPTGHGVIFLRFDSEFETVFVYCYVAPGGV